MSLPAMPPGVGWKLVNDAGETWSAGPCSSEAVSRDLRLQVLLTPQLPGLAAGRTQRCWFLLRRANRPWPAARALRGGGGVALAGSVACARSSWLAACRRRIGKCQRFGRIRGGRVGRYLLVLTWRRMFGLGGRPQHEGPLDQLDLEPVAGAQAKSVPKGGGQRQPPLIVELERRHERVLF